MIWFVLSFSQLYESTSATEFHRDFPWTTSASPHFSVEKKRSSRLRGVARASFRWEAGNGQRLQDANDPLTTLS